MYLVDTDVISELRRGDKGNPGVRQLFVDAERNAIPLFLSAVTIGELRQGVESVRHRGDEPQAPSWSGGSIGSPGRSSMPSSLSTREVAEIWGRLRVLNPQNPLDKQIAATALINDLTVVTRNTAYYVPTGVRLVNPFTE
jgi:toxin FitB